MAYYRRIHLFRLPESTLTPNMYGAPCAPYDYFCRIPKGSLKQISYKKTRTNP
ncbi:hypothetical protein [Alysiella crassa]|uniref:hypothetical protein n=1 Tax=Alysiella crassa TaxID=153491 RepID=UPI001FD5E1DF|nr:hypothetical protein [Alysiella crassa]UOP07774.1 hypothetical protein LVJ80_05345 [Alysiella crassa]